MLPPRPSTLDLLHWQEPDGSFDQRLDAQAMNGAYRKNLAETERGEFRRLGFNAWSIDFIDGDQDGLAAAAQTLGGLAIERHDTFLHTDDQNDDLGRFDGEFHLFEGRLDDHVIRFFTAQQSNPTGVHQCERAAAPFGLGADPVAGDAGLVVNDGDAASDNPVKQRRLSDVWPANNGN